MSVQKVHASVHSSIAPNGPEAETPAEERRGGGGGQRGLPGHWNITQPRRGTSL